MKWRIIFILVLISVIGAVFFVVHSKHDRQRRMRLAAAARAAAAAAEEVTEVVPDPELAASNALAEVQAWLDENPKLYDDAAERLESFAKKHPDTQSADIALQLAEELVQQKAEAIAKVVADLKLAAGPLEEKKEFAEALALFEEYEGAFKDETLDLRAVEVERLRALVENAEAGQISPVLIAAIETPLKEGVQKSAAFADEQVGVKGEAWGQLVETLERAERLGKSIADSFKAQKGETVSVALKSGIKRLAVAGAEKGAVLYYTKVGNVKVTKKLALSQLSAKELSTRAGEDLPGLYLRHLAAAANKKDFSSAKSYLEHMPSPLREVISGVIDKSASAGVTDAASNRLAMALFKAGLDVREIKDDPSALLELVERSELSSGMELILYAVARDLAIQYRGSEWIKDQGIARLLNALLKLKPEEGEVASVETDASDATESVDPKSIDWKKQMDF